MYYYCQVMCCKVNVVWWQNKLSVNLIAVDNIEDVKWLLFICKGCNIKCNMVNIYVNVSAVLLLFDNISDVM